MISSPRLLTKYVRKIRSSSSRKKALVPCHSSTATSASKSSVIVYHGMISQPIRAFQRSMSGCGARHERKRGVAGVQMGGVGDLIADHGAAGAATLRPAGDAG